VGFCGLRLVLSGFNHLVEERRQVARKAVGVSFLNSAQGSKYLRSLNSLKGGEFVD
jgi:hypothetical protein